VCSCASLPAVAWHGVLTYSYVGPKTVLGRCIVQLIYDRKPCSNHPAHSFGICLCPCRRWCTRDRYDAVSHDVEEDGDWDDCCIVWTSKRMHVQPSLLGRLRHCRLPATRDRCTIRVPGSISPTRRIGRRQILDGSMSTSYGMRTRRMPPLSWTRCHRRCP